MIRLVSDEDLDGRIVRGLLRRNPDLDLVRSQDVGLLGASDEKLLEWAADNQRIVVTHDKRTMPMHARDRLAAGYHLPGIFIVSDAAPIGECIDDLLLIDECSDEAEWLDAILYLPFARQ